MTNKTVDLLLGIVLALESAGILTLGVCYASTVPEGLFAGFVSGALFLGMWVVD